MIRQKIAFLHHYFKSIWKMTLLRTEFAPVQSFYNSSKPLGALKYGIIPNYTVFDNTLQISYICWEHSPDIVFVSRMTWDDKYASGGKSTIYLRIWLYRHFGSQVYRYIQDQSHGCKHISHLALIVDIFNKYAYLLAGLPTWELVFINIFWRFL